MKIFLTGATGFVGSHFLKKLLADSHEVISHIRSPNGIKTIEKLGGTYWLGSLNDIEALKAPLLGCDAVVHSPHILSFGVQRKILKMPILALQKIYLMPQSNLMLSALFLSVPPLLR
jgi:uncharacterized protein YbjT (DUF2867 family)